jgi:hypothetical protein
VKFFDVGTAAKRVGKTERTIRNWLDAGLPTLGGVIREDDLLEHERNMRRRKGRPKSGELSIGKIIGDAMNELQRQDAKFGEQNHEDGTGPTTLPLYSPHRFVDDDLTATTLADVFRARTDARLSGLGDRPGTWKDILLEEVFEAMAEEVPENLHAELNQVIAVCIQWRAALARRVAA